MGDVRSWLAVPGPGDYVTLVPADGSGPDFFVKLSDYQRVADELAALKATADYPREDSR